MQINMQISWHQKLVLKFSDNTTMETRRNSMFIQFGESKFRRLREIQARNITQGLGVIHATFGKHSVREN